VVHVRVIIVKSYIAAFIKRLLSGNALLFNVVVAALLTPILLYFKLSYHSILLLLVAASLVVHLKALPRKYKEYTRSLMMRSLMSTDRGLKSGEIRALRNALAITMVLVAALSAATALYTMLAGFNVVLIASTFIAMCTLATILLLPRLLVHSWRSQRKTSVEVELPYVIIMLRVISALKLPIYEIISLIENSVAFPALAREVKFARKIATVTRTSLLNALDRVFANHPSEKVANYLRRIITAAVTHGDYSSVAERVFDATYSWFESRVSGLVGNFTIIVGTSLFVHLFIPVIVAAVAPVMGGDLLIVLGVSLTMQVFTFFTLYAIVLSYFPSSLVVKPSSKLKVASLLAIVGGAGVVLLNVFSLVAGRDLP